jgi:hypothetical protein
MVIKLNRCPPSPPIVIATLTTFLSIYGSATVLFTALMPQATPNKNRVSALASCAELIAPTT